MKVCCSKCGKNQYEDYTDEMNGGTYETREIAFTFKDGNLICEYCNNET